MKLATGGVANWFRRPGRRLAVVAVVVLVLVALPRGSVAEPPFDYVLTVTTDYSVSGQVSTVDVLPIWTVETNVAPVHSDALARYYDGLVYVVNHLYGDNIQVLDPEQGFATVRQFSVGPGTNPQDIAFVSPERAYVSRYESAWLLEVDPTTGTVTDSVDLSGFADGDGLPEMAGLALRESLLFVALQRLDRDNYWLPVPPSYLVVIDTNTNEVVDPDPHIPGPPAISLTSLNPYREMHLSQDTNTLYVAESGAWGVLDGGIEAIDTATLVPQGLIATEAQLGGDLYDFTLPLGGRAHAVVTSSSSGWEQFCISFDWETGDKIQDVWRPGGYDVMDIETHVGTAQLFVTDRTYTNPGVRVFDATDDSQLTTSAMDVGLPPYDLVVIGDSVTGVVGNEVARPLVISARPNPFRAGTTVALSIVWPSGEGPPARSTGNGSAAIYDPAGRLVQRLDVSRGWETLIWDGTDVDGNGVAGGVYFVRASACDGSSGLAKLVFLK